MLEDHVERSYARIISKIEAKLKEEREQRKTKALEKEKKDKELLKEKPQELLEKKSYPSDSENRNGERHA